MDCFVYVDVFDGVEIDGDMVVVGVFMEYGWFKILVCIVVV